MSKDRRDSQKNVAAKESISFIAVAVKKKSAHKKQAYTLLSKQA